MIGGERDESLLCASRSVSGAVAFCLAALLFPTAATALEIGPGNSLCATAAGLEPGEELLLRPGDYRAGCVIRRGGLPGRPIVIRAADPARRPRLLEPGRPVNLLEIRASDVIIRELDFGPSDHSDGVRVIVGNRITVERCHFLGMGGIAVAANHASVQGLIVRRNVIRDSNATAMYFGCHDGASCIVSGLLVEGNYIRGVRAPNPQIGYGLEVKLNSSGIIRDNVVVDTKGPGIMIYGGRNRGSLNVVERNFVSGSRTSSGIVVGGGPAVVRNNVFVGNADSGIALEDYGGRGLLRGIVVAHNSAYDNLQAGISVPERAPVEALIVNNAVHARGGTHALPSIRSALKLAGNADCSEAPCFTKPEVLDFSPFPGSLLPGAGTLEAGDSVPADDFFGSRRHIPPAVGAVERPSGPIRLDIKP